MHIQQKNDRIIFGSFPFRGTMQAVRLLCQYIGVEYENKYFNPIQWEKYKQNQAKHWLYQKIPYMQCGELIITNSLAAAQYVVEKYNRTDLFGITQQERLTVNSSVSFQSIIMGALSLQCDMKKLKLTQEDKIKKREIFWKDSFYPKFKKAQQVAQGPWFFNHITMIDFFIYEDYLLFSKIYPQMKNFKKVREIFQSVSNLAEISSYEKSSRSIKDLCPNAYFQKFSEQYKKIKQSSNSCKQSCFTYCKEGKDSSNGKAGFCRYQKRKQEQSEMDLQ